ncbi:hypothetical protein F2P56_009599 [Juglans regia]|uniref:Uncharacterized protein LOC109013186 n=2 Tax=Juglans regia TaxID=51240 RepID=A0A2I4H3K7_JUGRE|nr:uncharacterized protein LOC109013186 [Juglans regia]KAF5472943.1 hypothetical protein F2P56_009599 [Juglans regia]
MDQEEDTVLAGQFDRGRSENSSSSVNGVASESMISLNSEERDSACVTGGNGALEALGTELGSSEVIMNGHEQVVNQEDIDQCGGSDVPHEVGRGANEDSSTLGGGIVPEIVIVINSNEALGVGGDDRGLEARISEPVLSKVSTKEVNKTVSEPEKTSCVIDMKCSSGKGFVENLDVEWVCRICHLGSEQSSHVTVRITGDVNMMTMMDLIQLGCGCKEELGIAHGYCAEAWFKIRGNRLCEICGKTAKNITGVGDNGFMEEWNGRRSIGGSSNPSNRGRGCWRGQPFCNFLMACLVIGFVLPWFFRVNMF